jgi:Flp pilus assembly protein TadG
MSRRGKGRSDRGAAAVEMALVLPLLIALVFGIIDFARIFNAEIQLSQAAREGVRLAAIGAPTYTSVQAVSRAKDAAPSPGFTANTISVPTVQMCSGTSGLNDTATVVVTFYFDGILWDHDLSQKAVMRCGG